MNVYEFFFLKKKISSEYDTVEWETVDSVSGLVDSTKSDTISNENAI